MITIKEALTFLKWSCRRQRIIASIIGAHGQVVTLACTVYNIVEYSDVDARGVDVTQLTCTKTFKSKVTQWHHTALLNVFTTCDSHEDENKSNERSAISLVRVVTKIL